MLGRRILSFWDCLFSGSWDVLTSMMGCWLCTADESDESDESIHKRGKLNMLEKFKERFPCLKLVKHMFRLKYVFSLSRGIQGILGAFKAFWILWGKYIQLLWKRMVQWYIERLSFFWAAGIFSKNEPPLQQLLLCFAKTDTKPYL